MYNDENWTFSLNVHTCSTYKNVIRTAIPFASHDQSRVCFVLKRLNSNLFWQFFLQKLNSKALDNELLTKKWPKSTRTHKWPSSERPKMFLKEHASVCWTFFHCLLFPSQLASKCVRTWHYINCIKKAFHFVLATNQLYYRISDVDTFCKWALPFELRLAGNFVVGMYSISNLNFFESSFSKSPKN